MCDIPDGEILYRYALPEALPEDQQELPPQIFNDSNLSCDWCKYQESPDESYQVVKNGKELIISIRVCDDIRNPKNPKNSDIAEPSWAQRIFHCPIEKDLINGPNPAHSLIMGRKKKAVQDAIIKNATWRFAMK